MGLRINLKIIYFHLFWIQFFSFAALNVQKMKFIRLLEAFVLRINLLRVRLDDFLLVKNGKLKFSGEAWCVISQLSWRLFFFLRLWPEMSRFAVILHDLCGAFV